MKASTKLIIILVVLALVAGGVGVGLGWYFMPKPISSDNYEQIFKDANKTAFDDVFTAETDGINKIVLDTASGRITAGNYPEGDERNNGNQITFSVKGVMIHLNEIKSEVINTFTNENGVITASSGYYNANKWYEGFFNWAYAMQLEVTLEVPYSYEGDIELDNASGVASYKFENTFKNVNTSIEAGTADFDIKASGTVTATLSSGTLSGKFAASSFSYSMSSGFSSLELDVKDTVSLLEISSGTLNAVFENAVSIEEFNVSSGYGEVKMPEADNVKLIWDVSSGTLIDDFTGGGKLKNEGSSLKGSATAEGLITINMELFSGTMKLLKK